MADPGPNMRDNQMELIESLRKSAVYPHPVSSIQVVETHISWVILTGQFAYKIKKAIDLGFLDFSTLKRRHHYCEEELRLNASWAPQMYLDVVSIAGAPGSPSFDDSGEVIEYAVKMLQFPQGAQLDRQLDDGLLREEDLRKLAETIADNHQQARVIDYANEVDSVGKVRAPILENFEPVERAIDMKLLALVHDWTASAITRLKPVLIQRRKDGFVRECHGDLHLSNLVRLDSGIVAFDCIEFSADLRNIDVLSDIAFLVMDLVACARQDLAYAFLNRYLERTGDYAGMTVFALYFVYHSMIRAKVAAIRSAERDNETDRKKDIEVVKHYLAVAVRWIKKPEPRLIGMHGYSGSGKTWLSSQLLTRLPAIRLRSDIERIRLFGTAQTAGNDAGPGKGVYSQSSKSTVYERLFETACTLIDNGLNVILDASFLQKAERQALVSLADKLKIEHVFVSTQASEAELQCRLQRRGLTGKDASEADIAVLMHQLVVSDKLDDTEIPRQIAVATDSDVDADDVIKAINRFI